MTEKSKLEMPDLSDLTPRLRNDRLLGNILGVHGPPSPRGKRIADGYVRLVERAILEYMRAHVTLQEFLGADGGLESYYNAQDHLENCVQMLHRAVLYLDQLRRLGFRRRDGSPFIPRPRDLDVLSPVTRNRIRALRDAIEHLDEDIIRGEIGSGDPVALHARWKGVRLAGHEISYEDLAKWIRELHHFAVLLSKFEIKVTNTDPAPSERREA